MIPWAPSENFSITRVKALTPVIACRQCSEPLLACRVPNLKFDDVSFMLDRLQFKVNPNCVKEIFIEGILCVPQEKT